MAAGASLGASIAPFSPVHFPTVIATRSRRLHGAFLVEKTLARVWSSRRAGDERGVLLALGTDTPAELIGRYTATQARMIARALHDAADAVELGVEAMPGRAQLKREVDELYAALPAAEAWKQACARCAAAGLP